MKYVNETCPVCKEVFTAESDVVVCPECGTPHHRECYAKLGHCVNEDKHASEFVWEAVNKPVPEEVAPKKEGKVPPVMPGLGPDAKNSANGVIGEIAIDKDGNQRPVYREIRENEKIGNATVKAYAEVIQKNVNKFIPKFMVLDKTGGKLSWNWAAFFFGPIWLAFRKMWKHATIAFLIMSIIPLVFASDISTYYEEVYDAASKLLMSDSIKTEEDLKAAQEEYLSSLPQQPRALTVASYVELAVRVVYTLFGNYLYKAHCEDIMRKAQKKGDEKAKAAYISRKGGRTVIGAIGFTLLISFAVAAVSAVLSVSGIDIATILRRFIK